MFSRTVLGWIFFSNCFPFSVNFETNLSFSNFFKGTDFPEKLKKVYTSHEQTHKYCKKTFFEAVLLNLSVILGSKNISMPEKHAARFYSSAIPTLKECHSAHFFEFPDVATQFSPKTSESSFLSSRSQLSAIHFDKSDPWRLVGFFITLGFWQIGSATKNALVLKKLHFQFSCFPHNCRLILFHQTLNPQSVLRRICSNKKIFRVSILTVRKRWKLFPILNNLDVETYILP